MTVCFHGPKADRLQCVQNTLMMDGFFIALKCLSCVQQDESGCLWYAWDRSGEKLFCNEAYQDAQAVLTHMKNLEKAGTFKDAAKLTQIEFHGPAVELEKLRSAAEAVNARLFTEDGGASFMHPLKPGADAEPASLCTLHAYYDLTDEGKAEPVLADLAARTKSESGCVYHGWTKAGDTLFCREGYLDSDAVLAHLSNVASCTGLADCTRLRRLELHGPPSQLAKLQDIAQQMGAECFERQEGFQRVALASAVKAEPLRGLHLDRTVLRDFCSIHAYYKVTNEEGVGRLLASFETRTRAEAGCLWYAWDRTDDRLFCNEAYANAEAVLAHVQHLEGVGSFGGAAQLTDIEFHGPAAELEKAMGSGFKFKASGNLFARTCGERSAFLYLEVMGTAKKLGAALFALESDVTFKPVDLCPEGKKSDLCTMHAYFRVEDESGVAAALAELVDKSRAEDSCMYYGWTRAGRTLFCREGYTGAAGILAHLANVSACGGLTNFAKPQRIEIHGPKEEIAKLQQTADEMGATCYTRQSGFQHFQARPALLGTAPLAVARRADVEPWRQLFRALAALKYVGLAGLALALLARLAQRTQRRSGRNFAAASLLMLLGHLAEGKLPSGECPERRAAPGQALRGPACD